MGAAANIGNQVLSGKANIGDFARIGLAAGTMGASELGYAAERTATGLATPQKTIADQMGVLQRQQAQQAADAEQKLLQAPKNITPDNFLAMKGKQLAALRLGMATSVGGSGMAQLGTTELGGLPKLKTRLGQ